jgi:hypothetical protein
LLFSAQLFALELGFWDALPFHAPARISSRERMPAADIEKQEREDPHREEEEEESKKEKDPGVLRFSREKKKRTKQEKRRAHFANRSILYWSYRSRQGHENHGHSRPLWPSYRH